MKKKSSIEEIRNRFDNDVERFSNLDTAQESTIDAPLVINLIAQVASSCNPAAQHILDIGCGAGNYTMKLLQYINDFEITLIDLSGPMLERAVNRISTKTNKIITPLQGDIRTLDIGENRYDIIMAAAVLHHLRSDNEWRAVFSKIFKSLKTGGSFWISDLIDHSIQPVQKLMWDRYGEYLTNIKDKTFQNIVFEYIEKEDTPRSVIFQLEMLKEAGFKQVEILHKNSMFAAFGGVK